MALDSNMFKLTSLTAFLVVLTLTFTGGFGQSHPIPPQVENKTKIGMDSLWGIGAKVGLNGVGLELVKAFTNRLNVRLGYSGLTFPFLTSQDMDGYKLQVDVKVILRNANLLVDYYPVRSIFHLTGGTIINNTRITFNVKSLSNLPYGDIIIPAEDMGTISGQISPGNALSPYLAIGVGNILSRKHRLSFNFELGILYQGSPRIELSGKGLIGPIASEDNEIVINHAIARYSWFPMLNFQLNYRIF